MIMRLSAVFVLAVAAMEPTGSASRLVAAIPEPPLRMSAVAVNMSNVGPAAANVVDIEIERWSTEAERDDLIAAFNAKGPDALLSRLQGAKRVGYMRLPNTLGYDLHYARKHPGDDGGEQIVIATDRRIGFWEARNQPRTIDYPFTLIDIRLKSAGEGEGKMSVATKISYNKKKHAVELENYASEPVRLTTVRVEAKK
jgi:hypothetical protein